MTTSPKETSSILAYWFISSLKEILKISLVMAAGVELVGKANPWMIWTGEYLTFIMLVVAVTS